MLTPRQKAALMVVSAALAAVTAACGSKFTAPAAPSPIAAVPVMGVSRLDAAQLVAWFNGRQPRPSGAYAATVPVETLAQFYVEEGAAEGVTGDVAFIQSIVKTGWYRFSGSVPAWTNNFSGMGASDTNPNPLTFPDARTGVRAQIQHLRAYADPTAFACAVPPLHHPCIDPRFDLVVPKGRAPTWNQMGNGNSATSPTYATSILTLFTEALAYNGLR